MDQNPRQKLVHPLDLLVFSYSATIAFDFPVCDLPDHTTLELYLGRFKSILVTALSCSSLMDLIESVS